eukprot:TRINITY_DN11758_c0_g1_i1.p1 TRINITY_DN11758_c0_g1~~TRINITY_DN11758_c0_g1_i1.p1  ORF type:complete len:163 (-),score=19.01 TRINITY_DN11758_c0_g1_i1:201-689(-)
MDNIATKQNVPICSLVWCPIPLISWIFCFIGHLGIVDSSGNLHDFAGPYTINVDHERTAFGKPTRFYKLKGIEPISLDNGIRTADTMYAKRMHNLFCDNCHSHVAHALEEAHYGKGSWNMFQLGLLMFFKSSFVSKDAILKTFLPSVVVWSLILLFVFVFVF